ncbi:autotransporter domain-containing protein [Proteus vulgaris]|uniref:autotransporter domain-containing protein n=1 Tax=Proteus vulgaris TaxID=585 RepID=UPI0006596758|nr:autotransporter domain-containing protein [Proteus vulgaris]CRL61594.1 Autotransporter beta-domain protein [Proteus vulgaris]
MKIKYNSILLMLCSTYAFPINSYGNYNIENMGHSIYKPFSIHNNAPEYHYFRNKKYEYIKYLHGSILDKENNNQQLIMPFGSIYIYTAIDDQVLSTYNDMANDFENKLKVTIPDYNIRNSGYFNESFLPNELFISMDGGKTIKKINKESNPKLDTLYLSHMSKNGKTVVGYATESKSILDNMIKNNNIQLKQNNCDGYRECYAFAYNIKDNTFSILEKNITIKYLTKDGNFILYKPKIDNIKKSYIYDINKKEEFELTLDNVNKHLANHPEKDILLTSITEYPFLNGIKRRDIDIQKISDNGKVFIGQLNRDLTKKQLNDSKYPKVAFISTKTGPIQEISFSKFGSSKLTDISADGNYSVGWGEIWHDDYTITLPHNKIKTSSALFSQALRYDLSNKILINIGNLSKKANESAFRNARATDISADGQYIIGWSETDDYNLETIPKTLAGTGYKAFMMFHRHGFIHFNNQMHDLGTLKNGKDSEAHAITDDGRIIYGLSTDEHNNWRQVIWKNDQLSDKYLNDEKQKIADENNKQAEQDRLAKEQADKAKEQADKAKAEQERLAKEQADKAKAEQDRLAKEQADKAKAEQNRLAKEQADKAKAEQDRLAKEQADKAKAEQERLAKEQADKAKAEQDRLAKEQADKAKAEQDRLAKEQADKAEAEQERLAKEQADKAKAEQDRLAKEQADKAKAEQERLAKEQADKIKAEQDRLAKEKANTKPVIAISNPIDIENTYRSMQMAAENGYKAINMQQGQLRYLASATCNVGLDKACISGFTHHQRLSNANATQTGLSGAYRVDIRNMPVVLGLALDTDIYSSLPKGYQYQGYPLPLIGFSIDLIPSLSLKPNNNALHLSLKGAYLNRKVSIKRPLLTDTEAGKGDAKIKGYHIDLQGYYPYSLKSTLTLTPFAGITFTEMSRSAYSETQGANFAAHYDKLNTDAIFAKFGLGLEYLLGSSMILTTKAGMYWHITQHQSNFNSHIEYLGAQSIDYTENKKQLKQRPFAHTGLTYQFDNHSSFNTSVNWEMTTYRYHDVQLGMSYTYRF